MKKNFLIGFSSALLLLSFLYISTRNTEQTNNASKDKVKAEINSNLPSSLLGAPEDAPSEQGNLKECTKEKGMCCKKDKPSSTPNDKPESEKSNRLEQLEDPDDVASSESQPAKLSLSQRFAEAAQIEFEKTKDPALGYVPSERLLEALDKTKRMQEQMQREGAYLRGALSNVRWIERGPNNIGGRTTAIQVDLNDKTGNTVFAAGVTGGLYKVSDVTGAAKWQKVNDWLDNLTVSTIAQDPRNPQIMYIGTGDVDASGAFVPGAGGTLGVGIYKSVDGGKTWNILPATTIPRSASYQYVSEIIVTPDSGYIFAATFTGVFKSKDGGATWRIVLGGKTWDIDRGSDGRVYAALQGGAYVSKSFGEAGTFNSMASGTGFPTNLQRVQIACAPSNPEVVYVVGSLAANTGSPIYRSSNGGTTWTQGATPPRGCGGGGEFTSGQAWYDLTIAVDPLNETMVWVGGIEQWRSGDGGANWQQMTGGYCSNSFPYSHVDQHALYFDPLNPSVLYLGNDGGVFRVTNPAGKHSIKELNNGYTTTQFYACAIHPDSGSNHFLAGAQDNNSILVSGSKNIGNGRAVQGGDGFYCFIDQDNPNIQIVSSQGGNWGLSTNGGQSFAGGRSSNGAFYCPADYDDKANILYAQTGSGELWRWKVTTSEAPAVVDVAGVTLSNLSQIYADQNVSNRIYIGTRTGSLYRVDSANVGTTLNNAVRAGSFTGYISSIDVENGNPNHILVCISSYGTNQIQETTDGGTTWRVCDGNLPDMPVRWGIFNPNDATQAMIATDAGVWTTELLNAATTTWVPPVPGRGIPIVRTDMLQYRASDKTVLAGTYGRGLWTTSVFGKAKAEIEYPQVAYLDVPVPFKGEYSTAAGSFLWRFNDGTTDTLENTQKIYKQIGNYDVSLTINNDNSLKATGTVKILPNLPTPYKTSTTGYAGNFDAANWDTHFGAWSAAGSKFVRGKSGVFGKDGTHSGQFAYVLDPTAQTYQKGTIAYLHLPNYDMTQTGIYQFSFWANYDAQLGRDGLQVEYSLDKGLTWRTLGSKSDPGWYNYFNNSVTDGAFAIGESMISGTADDWTRFKLNISNLAGNANVAFRFVFKAGTFVPGAGCAIDDVVISRYEGKNETAVIAQSGAFVLAGNAIDVKFQTQPEYYAQYFDLEMSENGRDWRKVDASITAIGGSTEELQDYAVNIKGTPLDLYYFRIRSFNSNTAANYKLDFRTTPFVVKRNKDLPLAINKVFPSPFTSFIGITFTDIPNVDVTFDLFDVAGRLITSQTEVAFNGVYHELPVPNLPKAVYLLRIKIGDNKPESIKLFGGN